MSSGIAQPLEKQFKELLRMQPQAILQSSAPEFLKIAALEQVNKASQAPAQVPQGTVAERVVQQSMSPSGNMGLPSVLPTSLGAPMPPGATPPPAMPPAPQPQQLAINQGIGGLPADMTMASGGIVSFAGGGGLDEEEERVANNIRAQRAARAEDPVDAFERRKKFYEETGEYYSDPYRDFAVDPITGMPSLSGLTALRPSDVERALREPELRPTEMRVYFPSRESSIPKEETKEPKLQEEAPPIEELATQFGLAGGQGAGIPTLPTLPKSNLPEKLTPYTRREFDYAKEKEKAIKEIGGLPDFFGSQRKAIADQQKELSEMQRMGSAEALVSAGQAIGNAYDPYGRPQTLLGALTEGLGAYTQSRQATNKEVREENRLLRTLESNLAKAEYAEKRGDVDTLVNASEKANDAINALDERNVTQTNALELKRAEAENTRDLAIYKAQASMTEAAYKEAGANNRAMFKAAEKRAKNTGISQQEFADQVRQTYKMLYETEYPAALEQAKEEAKAEGRVFGYAKQKEFSADKSNELYQRAIDMVSRGVNSVGYTQQITGGS